MSSRTWKSRGIYLVVGLCGAKYAHWKLRPEMKDAKFPDFPNLVGYHNLMAEVMTKTMYDGLKRVMSPSEFTLDKCIQVGVDIKGSALGKKDTGIVAGDIECYEIYADVFNGVMNGVFKRKEHVKSLESCREYEEVFDPKYVKGFKVRCFRNIKNFPLTPSISRGQRRHLELLLSSAFPSSQGGYSSLAAIPRNLWSVLTRDGVIFAKPTSEQDRVSGITRDWPDARGLYLTNDRKLSAWVNGRHHLEITSYQSGGDFGKAVSRLADFTSNLEEALPVKYNWTSNHGYLGHDVPEIGSALSMEATLFIPKLCTDFGFLRRLGELGLRPLTHPDEHMGVWKVASKPTFDTEVEHVKNFANAIQTIIEEEKALSHAK